MTILAYMEPITQNDTALFYMVIITNRNHDSMVTNCQNENEAKEYVASITEEEGRINPDKGYLWATITPVYARPYSLYGINTKCQWETATQIS